MTSLPSTLRTCCQRIPFRRHPRGSVFSLDGANQAGNEMQTRETVVAGAVIAAIHSDVAIPESSCADPTTFREILSDEPSIDTQSTVNDSIFAGYREKIFEEEIPSRMGHHDREYHIPNEASTFSIPPLLIDFEGFSLETVQSDALAQRTITEEWIYDDRFENMVTTWASILNTVLSRSPSSLQVKDRHLVIKILEYSAPAWTDDDCYRCQYYFVNHDNESLFWLSEFIIDEHLTAIRGPVTYSQIRHFLRQEYWYHMYLFSDTHPLSGEQWKTANHLAVLAHAHVTTSTTSSHSASELQAMIWDLSMAEKMNASEVAADVMRKLLFDQFLNYHGQRSARTNRGDSVFGYDPDQAKCTLIFKLLTPFLFYAPVVHLNALNKYWVDGIARNDQWKTLMGRCTSEWSSHTVNATILLNANVAFLAIPSVDESLQASHGSVTQVLCALSIIGSLSSILIGLLLGRYHQGKKNITCNDIVNYVKTHYSDSMGGFERLAIIYSVPYALLMWA
ncbi:hypothetical protein EV421DRAFT_2029727 [Armillaria borealis]|uniref:Uncharacterized protein n=1 Tax=Armillaria borealis TaxID=47425 RepID=A0AA39K532_9AGAR|nr:hypothetical protein EV421DRAFT_2029727 [Armillaria borealis]